MKKIFAIIVAAILAITLTACDFGDKDQSAQRKADQKASATAYDKQRAAVPFPAEQMNDSLERRNLRERLLRQNEADRIGYVYFISFGKFLGYWTIEGKVSSTQSQMLPVDEQSDDLCGSGCSEHVITESAGDDGSFGQSEDGVFFFTTEGAMIQLPEDQYVYSDQPIAIGSIPELNGEGTVKSAE